MRWVKVPRDLRREFGPLEESLGARPAHWYIADRSLRIEYDPLPGTPPLTPAAVSHA